jgi:hypothetical protein
MHGNEKPDKSKVEEVQLRSKVEHCKINKKIHELG